MKIVRKIRLAHCKRGPEACDLCRQWDAEAWCLLELFEPGESLQQRRTIEVEIASVKLWREFDVLRRFETEDEARAYQAAQVAPQGE